MDFYIDLNDPQKSSEHIEEFFDIAIERSKHRTEGVRINLRGEVKHVGHRFAVLAAETYKKLFDEFGERLEETATLAHTLFWMACYIEALFVEGLVNAGTLPDNEDTRIMADPEHLATFCGRARILEQMIYSQKNNETLDNRLKDGTVFFLCVAVHWINMADDLIGLLHRGEEKETVPKSVLCFLADGAEAIALARVITAQSEAFTSAGKNGADIRHAKHRQEKKVTKNWYIENRGRFKSLDQAAYYAFKEGVAPRTIRTIRDWIGEAEREMRSSGKP
jgi:hypothetical protein